VKALPYLILSALCASGTLAGCSSDASSGGGQTGGSGGTTSGSGGASSGGSGGGSTGGSSSGTGGESGSSGGTTGGSAGASDDAGSLTEGGSDLDATTGADDGGSGIISDAGLYAGMRSLFDGTTLDGWIQKPDNSWDVMDGAMHSKGTNRGFIYTKENFGDYRLIFTERLVGAISHQACVLLFGTDPGKDALGAIQFQPPNGFMWDYRTGKNNNPPASIATHYDHPKLSATEWSQCEILAHSSKGEFHAACCNLTGAGPCNAVEVVWFHDPTAASMGPIAWQVHNKGMQEEFKDVYIEVDPKVDKLITVH
jgi:hypothetical protein